MSSWRPLKEVCLIPSERGAAELSVQGLLVDPGVRVAAHWQLDVFFKFKLWQGGRQLAPLVLMVDLLLH